MATEKRARDAKAAAPASVDQQAALLEREMKLAGPEKGFLLFGGRSAEVLDRWAVTYCTGEHAKGLAQFCLDFAAQSWQQQLKMASYESALSAPVHLEVTFVFDGFGQAMSVGSKSPPPHIAKLLSQTKTLRLILAIRQSQWLPKGARHMVLLLGN
jgi:hypothetical protein